MKNKYCLLLFIFIIIGIRLKAQSPEFIRAYKNGNYGNSVIRTMDSGYAICGTDAPGAGSFIVKTNSGGDVIWAKTYYNAEFKLNTDIITSANTIVQTSDGGFVIAGSTGIADTYYGQILLFKVDVNGNVLWSNEFGYTGNNGAFAGETDMIKTRDGGFIISGNQFIGFSYSGIVVKTDSTGKQQWQVYNQIYETSAIVSTFDKGYVITGFWTNSDETIRDVAYTKIDSTGNTVWFKKAPIDKGFDFGSARSIIQLADGDFLLNGFERIDGQYPYYNSFIKRITANGDSVSFKFIPNQNLTELKPTNDGDYILVGETNDTIPAAILLRLNANLATVWSRTYNNGLVFSDIIENSDKSFGITGSINNKVAMLLKMDSLGHFPPLIYAGPLLDSAYCINQSLAIPFGLINGAVSSGNIFTVQLSDSAGNFANAVNIGSDTSIVNSATINVTIPSNTLPGGNYEIRVVASKPALTSSATTKFHVLNKPTISITSANICKGGSDTLKASGADNYYWSPSKGLSVTTGAWVIAKPTASVTYTVSGGNFCGYSSVSAIVNVYFLLSAPELQAATNVTSSQFKAGWYSSSDATSYFLDVSLKNDFSSFVGGYSNLNMGNVSSYTVIGLKPNTNYYYRVRAYNVCGESTSSPGMEVSTINCTAIKGGTVLPVSSIICPATTQMLTLSNNSGDSLHWQISSDNQNWSKVSAGGNTSSYITLTGDGLSKKYYRCLSGNACYSAASTSVIVDVSRPSISVNVSAITDKSLTINWLPVGAGNYQISYSGTTIGIVNNATPPVTLSGLTANGNYNITVTQTTPAGCPATGEENNVSTLCSAPANLKTTAATANSISLSWTGEKSNYRVYYRQLFSGFSGPLILDVTSATTAMLNSLQPGATYYIYVTQKDCPQAGSMGKASDAIYATTVVANNCTAPVIDSVKSLCSAQLLVWLHGSASNLYTIYIQRLTPTLQAVSTYNIKGGNFSLNVPVPGQTYLISASSNCNGQSSGLTVWKNEIAVEASCNPLSNLLLSQPSCKGFTAAWNADNCLSNVLTSYQLYIRKTGSLSWNTYSVSANPGYSPYETVNWLAPNTSYQCYVRSAYSCSNYKVYGPSSAMQTIMTTISGCRLEPDQSPDDSSQQILVAGNSTEILSIYPNPNTGQFVINLNNLSTEQEAVTIEVTNLIGQAVLTYAATINNGHLNEFINLPGGASAGMYIVRVIAGKNVYTGKINVNR